MRTTGDTSPCRVREENGKKGEAEGDAEREGESERVRKAVSE